MLFIWSHYFSNLKSSFRKRPRSKIAWYFAINNKAAFWSSDKKKQRICTLKNYIEAWVGVKSNCYRGYHEDSHYLFGRNKQRQELAPLSKDEIAITSTDDMAKVKDGVLFFFLFIKFILFLEKITLKNSQHENGMTKTLFITGNNFLHFHGEYNTSWAGGMRTQEERKKMTKTYSHLHS